MPKERVERDEEDLVRLYLTDIGQYPLLTKDDEVRLAKAIEAGNEARSLLEAAAELQAARRRELRRQAQDGEVAQRTFVQSNLRLVVSIAKKYQASGLPLLMTLDDPVRTFAFGRDKVRTPSRPDDRRVAPLLAVRKRQVGAGLAQLRRDRVERPGLVELDRLVADPEAHPVAQLDGLNRHHFRNDPVMLSAWEAIRLIGPKAGPEPVQSAETPETPGEGGEAPRPGGVAPASRRTARPAATATFPARAPALRRRQRLFRRARPLSQAR